MSFSICTVFATDNTQNNTFISKAFIVEADYQVIQLDSGENVILLSKTQELEQTGTMRNYESTIVAMFPDSQLETINLIDDISSIKQQAAARGYGSYTDEGWYHGSTVCVRSTLNYYTTESNGIRYGGMTSVYVACSVHNSTILDDISLRIHQEGFTDSNGRKTYEETYDINNWSTTTAPSSWVPVLWEGGVGSLVGARVTITVHRGTSKQYNYSFVNNLVE